MKKTQKAPTPTEVTKVRVTIWLDSDVVEHFKGRAGLPNAAHYQTQINDELRRVMGRGGGPYASLLNDEKFIEAVAEQVKKRSLVEAQFRRPDRARGRK